MPPTEPPLRPSDPEAFRRLVYRRAASLRRRRLASLGLGAATACSVLAILLSGALTPLLRSPGTQAAPTTVPTGSTARRLPGRTTSTNLSTVPSTSVTGTTSPVTGDTTAGPSPSVTVAPPTTTTTTLSRPVTTVSTTPRPSTSTTSTTVPPHVAVVSSACGDPAAPATPATPAVLKRELVGTWVQCTGPSIFGPGSGGAVEMLSNGTWQQLERTTAGWVPLHGNDDSGTWQLLPAPTAVTAARAGILRLVATAPGSASTSAPRTWTVRVMVTLGPPERARFAGASGVANYRFDPKPASSASPAAS